MKVLIWIGCVFAEGTVITILKKLGITLGALPTMALFGLTLWLARTLCKKYDAHKENSRKNTIEDNIDTK